MAHINPYLNFNGNCEEAFNFYRSVFGGEFQHVGRYNQMPQEESQQIPENFKNKIMHISLPISKESWLMGCDAPPSYGEIPSGQNISLTINTDSREEADRLFNKLSEDANITMPMEDTFWNSYFGMLTDRFGISWMINFENPVSEPKGETAEVAANI